MKLQSNILLIFGIFLMFSFLPSAAATFRSDNGVTIDYEVTGEGEALVMLHSGMMSRDDMRLQIDYFSNFYQVIAVDAREQGRSSSSNEQITYELMVSDLIGLLDHLEIKKTSIFGQSDGGITGLLSAHYHPDRVEKLIIHGAVFNHSAYDVNQVERWNKIKWNAESKEDNDPDGFPGMAIASYLLGRKNLSEFEKHLQEMARMWSSSPNLTVDDLNKINVSTLVIVGDHYDIPLSHTVEMHEVLKNSELFVVPGATHFVHQEKPDLLNKVIHDFLKQ